MEAARSEPRVTPLELFFDLVFVFALTQVTAMLAADPTWEGLARGMLVLAALWWAWAAYARLTNEVSGEDGRARLVVFLSMGAMMLVALGESIVAIGVGAGEEPVTLGVATGVLLGVAAVAALWWAYFDVMALVAESRLAEVDGVERTLMARDSYAYLHLPMIAGIVLFALGLKSTLAHVDEPLHTIPAVGLGGGVALYLLAHVLFRLRNGGSLNRPRLVAAAVCALAIPALAELDALVALAAVTAVCVGLIAYETIAYRETRARIRLALP